MAPAGVGKGADVLGARGGYDGRDLRRRLSREQLDDGQERQRASVGRSDPRRFVIL